VTGAAPAPPEKLDPERLAIRTRPIRAIRFRRGVIIALVACGSAGLTAVAWFALKPASLSRVAERQDLADPSAPSANDALDKLPATYATAPKLGPPLPGDLGRPILARQREWEGGTGASSDAARSAAQAVQAERERQAEELRAARQSGLLVPSRSTPDLANGRVQQGPGPAESPADEMASGAALGGRDPKTAFVARLDQADGTSPHRLTSAASPYAVAAGSVIAASLITGLRSDLPGLVTAQVTEPVFDSATGQVLLIPQGTRLIGSYDSVVAFGQKRALVVWQRILLPDGRSLRLDNAPAADPSGYAGLEDRVDFHSWSLLKGVALSTLLGLAPELLVGGDGDIVQAIRRATQDSGARAGDQLVQRNLDVQPTITIRPGARVRLLVHKDLVLEPWSFPGGKP